MSNAVCFAYAPEKLPADSRLPDRVELFEILKSNDLRPFVTLGGESAFTNDHINPSRLDGDVDPITSQLNRNELGLIVNRLDRSIKHDSLSNPDVPPMINENAVRKIGYHKERAAREILSPLGLSMPTALITSSDDIDRFVQEHDYDQYFLKPRHGSFSAGTYKMGKAALAKFYSDNPNMFDKHIVQPAYDFSRPFPRSIKSLTRSTNEEFDRLNVAGNTKELRMYSFVSPGKVDLYPAARVLQPDAASRKTVSAWFFVDPESIPQTLIEQATDVTTHIASITGSYAMYGAVDFGYGTADSQLPDWKIIELNILAPGMISRSENRFVATKLKTLLSNQIRATIDQVAKIQ